MNWQGLGLTPGRANTANQPPLVAITSPAHLTTFVPPGAFTITSNASDADGQIVRVEFYDCSVKLGEDTAAPYALAVTNMSAGDHLLTARIIDDAFSSTTSIPILITGLGTVPVILSPWGATWRYRDNNVAPPATWTQLFYDDSAWSSGPGELGYGDGDEARIVEDNPTPGYNSGDTNRYITTWFRRTFTVANAAQITALAARMIRDDGVAVYLNGVEIWRDNLIANAGPGTPATNSISGASEAVQITKVLNAANLVEGVNVLAVEIHQQAADSSDISFNFELTAERPGTAPDPDTDGDGMRDTWEIANGFSYWDATDAAQDADADADGTANRVEYLLALDPRNGAQSFRAAATKAPGGITLTWPSAPGRTFTIQRAPTLHPAAWQNIATVPAPAGAIATFTDTSGGTDSFYRVVLTF